MQNYGHFHRHANSEWKNVSLSDVRSIKGLLKFRYKFDKFKKSDSPLHLKNAHYYQWYLDEDIMCTYIWMDDMIDKCDFTLSQMNVLEMYSSGYSERDIAMYTEYTQQNVNKVLNGMCRRIFNKNYEEWYYKVLTVNHIVAPYDYKECSGCHERLPLTQDFFGVDNQNKDGYRHVCKTCRKGEK